MDSIDSTSMDCSCVEVLDIDIKDHPILKVSIFVNAYTADIFVAQTVA